MKHPESALQKSVMAYLEAVLPLYVRAFSVPNGMRLSATQARIAKAEGLRAGVPDICIVHQGGSVAFIELKTAKGRLSPAQTEWLDWCAWQRVPAAVCRSIDDVRSTLSAWGIETREAKAAPVERKGMVKLGITGAKDDA